ncbi:M13 family metallopeptidase [Gluconacetobacter entanii]|uniref:M13 family metallopeptidase n=1 Tax=Gluconacetobacter entanii TaxID=108528 RepID=A0ABT3K4D5_9PROT|nr:M13 family metallopeptidase [Gluconacetobacter entanii]MCW4590259.1 M13 family metallopeptidase [Gluconacetobacter entanii]MCW4593862.1 M13 family metallopeptidase [Gluconacetobacter entanii]
MAGMTGRAMRAGLMGATLLATCGAGVSLAAPVTQGAANAGGGDFGRWGFDLAGRDTSVAPGNDFFEYADGTAVRDIVIPPDMTSYGPFNALAELSRTRVRSILEELSTHPVEDPQTIEQKLGTFYATFLDEKTIEAHGIRPLSDDLAQIRAIRTATDFASLSGTAQVGFQFTPFALSIQPDARTPTKYTLTLDQAGLGMPDRDYYLKPEMQAKKSAYQAYVAQMLGLIRWPDARGGASAIVALETSLAQAHWARQDMRDPDRIYNPLSLATLQEKAPGFDWLSYLKAAGIPDDVIHLGNIIVGEPSAITTEAQILARTDMTTLRAWLAFHLADNAAQVLPRAFVNASFNFHGKILSGQPQLTARWKRAGHATSEAMGMALGKVYVSRYFPAPYHDKMVGLTQELKAAFRIRLKHNEWMGKATRKAAIRKLDSSAIQIGYPNKWRDYTGLVVHSGDAYGNSARGVGFEWSYWLAHLGKPVDRDEWDMTPQTVNAYNNPVFNEVVFPAAILQPPFFNPSADMAINYGAIGGVIGHEMTHSFDDEGRKFDEKGQLRDWWTKKDEERFNQLSARFGAQYDAFEVLPGVHLNGKLTMGENIADLGGLTLALDAYHASLKGKEAPVIDGMTGDQRVFLGWAQVWREKLRDDTIRQRVITDPHSPPRARVNMPMHNIDAWYKAWNVQPGQSLYIKPESRVKIW